MKYDNDAFNYYRKVLVIVSLLQRIGLNKEVILTKNVLV